MYEDQYLSQFTEDNGKPMLDCCDFCLNEIEEFIYVTDSSGDRYKMCLECFCADEPEVSCRCGCTDDPLKQINGSLTCPECGNNTMYSDHWTIPWSVSELKKNVKFNI